MKKACLLMALLMATLLLGACAGIPGGPGASPEGTTVTPAESEGAPAQEGPAAEYRRIAAQQAKEIMDQGGEYILLDVRTQQEFDAGFIPGAILIPDYELAERAEADLPHKDAVILVYCRSGNRSASSAKTLVGMGYTQVYDFGGIGSWPFEVQKP